MKCNRQEVQLNDDEYEKDVVRMLLLRWWAIGILLSKLRLVLRTILLLNCQYGKSNSLLKQKRLCAQPTKISPKMDIVTIVAALNLHLRLYV